MASGSNPTNPRKISSSLGLTPTEGRGFVIKEPKYLKIHYLAPHFQRRRYGNCNNRDVGIYGSDDGGSDSGENVTNGLYAHYKFEGDCKNSADGAPSAQPINSPSYVDGVSGGKALKFSVSDNSYISVSEPLIDGGTYSISFWVKGLSDGHIFHVVSSGQYGLGFVLTMRDGALTFMSDGYEFVYQYNNVTSFAHPTIDSSKWTMVTLTSKYTSGVEKSEVKLYLNGEYVDVINEEGVGYQNVNYGTKFVFGGEVEYYGGSMRSCGMSIDNLRVYDNRVLTSSEVEKIYNYEK